MELADLRNTAGKDPCQERQEKRAIKFPPYLNGASGKGRLTLLRWIATLTMPYILALYPPMRVLFVLPSLIETHAPIQTAVYENRNPKS